MVGWDKDAFRGRDALEAERAVGVRRRLLGLTTPGRQPPRAGLGRRGRRQHGGHGDERQLLAHARARHRPGPGRTRPRHQPGASLSIALRGRSLDGTVVTTPFVHAGQWAGTR